MISFAKLTQYVLNARVPVARRCARGVGRSDLPDRLRWRAGPRRIQWWLGETEAGDRQIFCLSARERPASCRGIPEVIPGWVDAWLPIDGVAKLFIAPFPEIRPQSYGARLSQLWIFFLISRNRKGQGSLVSRRRGSAGLRTGDEGTWTANSVQPRPDTAGRSWPRGGVSGDHGHAGWVAGRKSCRPGFSGRPIPVPVRRQDTEVRLVRRSHTASRPRAAGPIGIWRPTLRGSVGRAAALHRDILSGFFTFSSAPPGTLLGT